MGKEREELEKKKGKNDRINEDSKWNCRKQKKKKNPGSRDKSFRRHILVIY